MHGILPIRRTCRSPDEGRRARPIGRRVKIHRRGHWQGVENYATEDGEVGHSIMANRSCVSYCVTNSLRARRARVPSAEAAVAVSGYDDAPIKRINDKSNLSTAYDYTVESVWL